MSRTKTDIPLLHNAQTGNTDIPLTPCPDRRYREIFPFSTTSIPVLRPSDCLCNRNEETLPESKEAKLPFSIHLQGVVLHKGATLSYHPPPQSENLLD
jgi:hypothetical protein